METNKSVEAFISRCWMNEKPCTIQPQFDFTYFIDETKIKFTQEVLELIEKDDRVKVTSRTEKGVNIMGIEGMNI